MSFIAALLRAELRHVPVSIGAIVLSGQSLEEVVETQVGALPEFDAVNVRPASVQSLNVVEVSRCQLRLIGVSQEEQMLRPIAQGFPQGRDMICTTFRRYSP